MGFIDKITGKAKKATATAQKAAEQALDNASKTAKNLSKKAADEMSDLSDKASKGFAGFSHKATELQAWAETMPDQLRKMADDFDAEAMWDKLSRTAAKAGQELIVMVLTIYYAIESRITGK